MGPAHLKELHRTLQKECSGLLPTKVHIVPTSGPDWEQTPANGTFGFELFPQDPAYGEAAIRGRNRRHVSVLLLHPRIADSSSCYWISWYEQWRKDDKSGFDLLTASWTVYCGISAQPKAQLVRADWDQLATNTGSKNAGQPHWHFDQPVAVSSAMPPSVSTVALREVQSIHVGSSMTVFATSPAMSVDHVHLAMGGWEAQASHPGCWQREAKNWREICTWATRTLKYLQDQFRRR